MRKIKYIVIHCTATTQKATIQAIQNYWKYTLGWSAPGYHYIVTTKGNIQQLAPHNDVCNGVKGYNQHSIHISYIGGVDNKNKPVDNRTELQKQAILSKLKYLKSIYQDAVILGHRDFPGVTKACPSFDAKKEYQNI